MTTSPSQRANRARRNGPLQRNSPWPVRTLAAAALADTAVVVVFAATGRSSHSESNSALAVLETAWPFLVGLAIGWTAFSLWSARRLPAPTVAESGRPATPTPHPLVRPYPAGVVIAATAWGVGLLLRLATDSGVSGAFPLVALAFLAATLIGWRLIVSLLSRRGTQRSSEPAP